MQGVEEIGSHWASVKGTGLQAIGIVLPHGEATQEEEQAMSWLLII